jgi:hypothetical protein
MTSQNAGSLVAMTELGFANELGSGKVRWRSVQESLKGSLVSGTGSNITALSVSSDSEWLAYGRRNVGVFILKLQGGSGTEVALPMTNSGLGAVVTAIHLHRTGSGKSASYVLYAGDATGSLVSWHFKDEHSTIANPQVITTELSGITSIVSHLDHLFVAIKDGTKVVSIALASGRPQDDFPQCASPPIRGLNVALHINSLIVTTQHRHLSVYSLIDHKSVQYLSGEGAPLRVDVSPHLFEQEFQHILGVSELGEISIWKVTANPTTNKKPLQPSTRVKLENSSTKGHLILSASFSHARRGVIIVSYGTSAKPMFTDLTYWDESTGNFHPKLSISSSDRNALLDAPSSNGKESVMKPSKEEKGRLVGSMDGVVAHSTFKNVDSMQVDYPQDSSEIPFSQLVKQQSKTGNKSTASLSTNATSSSSSASTLANNITLKSDLPRATSAVAALVAALSTNDKSQLNLILAKHDEQFITSTLRQLPVSQVLPLLTELLSSFSSKASLPVISWTRHLLIIHQSYLASAPDLINKLSGLYNTVDERLKNFPDLLKLSGRFDLLLAHLRDDEAGESHGKRALQTYVEEDDDLPDYEDDKEESGEEESDDDSFGYEDDGLSQSGDESD